MIFYTYVYEEIAVIQERLKNIAQLEAGINKG